MIRPFLFFTMLIWCLLSSCCYDTTSEGIKYRGAIHINGQTRIDTLIKVYSDPDSNGSFGASGTTSSHCINEKVEQWQCGPLRILIEGDSIVTYYDSLTDDQLKVLKQDSAGEWVLPTITLQRK
ncbi:MAG TPA: hypothetical protein VKF42_03305 [Chitinivibrionales bacterium]|nr:hypothetical protein [Chitinivibrionales bacterium]